MLRSLNLFRCIFMAALMLGSGAAVAAQPAVVYVIDSSNSMWSQIDGEHKVVHIRSVLGTALGALAGKAEAGVVSFGHREQNACKDYETVVPVGSVDQQASMQAISQLNPKGATPIAASLQHAVQAAQSNDASPRVMDIVLVFDGPDNCAGDPCQVASELVERHPGLRIHAVAFKKGSADDVQPLSCLARISGGTFFNATNRIELETAFNAITAVALSHPKPTATASNAQSADAQPQPTGPVNPLIASSEDSGAPSTDASPAPEMLLPILRSDPVVTGSVTSQNGDATQQDSAAQPDAAQPNASETNAANPVDPMQAIQQQIENENRPPDSRVKLSAMLTAESQILDAGLVWRVFSSKPDEQGNFRVVARKEEARPVFELSVGKYIVHVAYGRANVTQEVDVGIGSQEELVILNAGGLRLSSSLEGGAKMDSGKVNYTIYSSEVDEFGQRKLLLSSAPENLIIRLNAGTYHVLSQYGDANAIVRADVQIKPGELTEAIVSHQAAYITFKLVNQEGGEALAGTSWSILSPEGEVIVESVGAFPSYILAAGGYSVLAQNGGKSFNRTFNVVAGRDQEVEVVTE
ncbi:MAG: VWA domain-containing protein [Fimbriimonadaceae bacterium]|nr:VWA domain-containing protein [Alphaproteobacteria bacterium]